MNPILLLLRPRVLRHFTRSVDPSTTVLGQPIAFPVATAPTMSNTWFHPDGDVHAAKAAAEAGSVFVTGIRASTTMEDIVHASPSGIKWFQFVPTVNPTILKELIKRAEAAQYQALVWTVNAPIVGMKNNWERNAFAAGDDANYPNMISYFQETTPVEKVFEHETAQNWEMLTWLRSLTKLPIIIKGIQHPEDALLAVKYGASAIIVSNIGGRSLDGVPATIDSLHEITKAIDGKLEVYCEGGVRSGSDVLKCLALGARAVFVGRPTLWGLACGGQAGVKAVLDLLKKELVQTMYHCGCSSIADITSDLVIKKYYYANL